jgi:glucosyl-dolichyl phosphate glucuronosyltransferase
MPDDELRKTAFTVAIGTLNRRQYLEQAVTAVLSRLENFPNGRLMVIDNGSTDDTERYLKEVGRRNRKLLSVKEPRKGQYYTRVRAIEEVQGEFLIFFDDDATPRVGWPEGLLHELMSSPHVGVVACAIEPIWEAPRPQWLSERLMREIPVLPAHRDREKHSFPSFPPGMSIALRINECSKMYVGPERQQGYPLGRKGTYQDQGFSLVGGDDADLCQIYARNGYEVITVGHVAVGHCVQPERLTPEWYLRKFRNEGHGRVRLSRVAGYRSINRHTVKMIAALPLFAGLKVVDNIFSFATRFMVEAYYLKCLGAWEELLFGPKIKPLPYKCNEGEKKLWATPKASGKAQEAG